MKKIFLAIFQSQRDDASPQDREHSLRLATATLLVEVVRADFTVEESELAHLRALLQREYALDAEELDALMQQAHEGADRLVSLQHITRLMNENFDHATKLQVVEMMWELVFADDHKDHYEEHLIRQVAELLYLSHEEFIRARHRAEPAQ